MNERAALAFLRRLPLDEAIQTFCPEAVPAIMSSTDSVTTATSTQGAIHVARRDLPSWAFLVTNIAPASEFSYGVVRVTADEAQRLEANLATLPQTLVRPIIARDSLRFSLSRTYGVAVGDTRTTRFQGYYVPLSFAALVARIRGQLWGRLLSISSSQEKRITVDNDTELDGIPLYGATQDLTTETGELQIALDGVQLFGNRGPHISEYARAVLNSGSSAYLGRSEYTTVQAGTNGRAFGGDVNVGPAAGYPRLAPFFLRAGAPIVVSPVTYTAIAVVNTPGIQPSLSPFGGSFEGLCV